MRRLGCGGGGLGGELRCEGLGRHITHRPGSALSAGIALWALGADGGDLDDLRGLDFLDDDGCAQLFNNNQISHG